MRRLITFTFLLLVSFGVFPQGQKDPSKGRLVFADVDRFWEVFDKYYPSIDSAELKAEYLDRMSADLKQTYVPFIIGNDGKELEAAIRANLAHYYSLKKLRFDSASIAGKIRKPYAKLKRLYDETSFPDVYFAVGRFISGGAYMNGKLAISIELFPAKATKVGAIETRSYSDLPATLIHEVIHFQQRYTQSKTLLARSIKEGAADFVSELVCGRHSNKAIFARADENEKAIWTEFQKVMNGTELHNWLYTHDAGRIKDLGYYMGYKITKSYYRNASNKRTALKDILNINDFKQFLADSGYGKELR